MHMFVLPVRWVYFTAIVAALILGTGAYTPISPLLAGVCVTCVSLGLFTAYLHITQND
jgi:hypothetical protein